jgi:hypothetical protein
VGSVTLAGLRDNREKYREKREWSAKMHPGAQVPPNLQGISGVLGDEINREDSADIRENNCE